MAFPSFLSSYISSAFTSRGRPSRLKQKKESSIELVAGTFFKVRSFSYSEVKGESQLKVRAKRRNTVYQAYKEQEKKRPSLRFYENALEKRKLLVSWLLQWGSHAKLSGTTKQLAIANMARYLSLKENVTIEELLAIPIVSLALASKFEDDEPTFFNSDDSIQHFAKILKGSLTTKELVRLERDMLHLLDFNLDICTSSHLTPYFLESLAPQFITSSKVNRRADQLSVFCMWDNQLCHQKPSLLSNDLNRETLLSRLEGLSKYSEEQIQHLAAEIDGRFQLSKEEFLATQKKTSSRQGPSLCPFAQELNYLLLEEKDGGECFAKNKRYTAENRKILFDWIFEVTEKFQLLTGTALLATVYIERYLSLRSIDGLKYLQAVGVTALMLSSELKEPTKKLLLSEAVVYCDGAYTEEELLKVSEDLRAVFDKEPEPVLILEGKEETSDEEKEDPR